MNEISLLYRKELLKRVCKIYKTHLSPLKIGYCCMILDFDKMKILARFLFFTL